MSNSSIYVIDHNFYGSLYSKYRNSWWFSPVVWNVLLDKYLHDEIQTSYGKKSLLGDDGDKLAIKLNRINKELIMIMGTELVIMDALINHTVEKLLNQYLFVL